MVYKCSTLFHRYFSYCDDGNRGISTKDTSCSKSPTNFHQSGDVGKLCNPLYNLPFVEGGSVFARNINNL